MTNGKKKLSYLPLLILIGSNLYSVPSQAGFWSFLGCGKRTDSTAPMQKPPISDSLLEMICPPGVPPVTPSGTLPPRNSLSETLEQGAQLKAEMAAFINYVKALDGMQDKNLKNLLVQQYTERHSLLGRIKKYLSNPYITPETKKIILTLTQDTVTLNTIEEGYGRRTDTRKSILARINGQGKKEGDTVAHRFALLSIDPAVKGEIFTSLAMLGADFNIRNKKGETVLHQVVREAMKTNNDGRGSVSEKTLFLFETLALAGVDFSKRTSSLPFKGDTAFNLAKKEDSSRARVERNPVQNYTKYKVAIAAAQNSVKLIKEAIQKKNKTQQKRKEAFAEYLQTWQWDVKAPTDAHYQYPQQPPSNQKKP